MMDNSDLEFLLNKIKLLTTKNNRKRSTYRNIWVDRGVWLCVDELQVLMNKAIYEGYMTSEDIRVGKYNNTVYRLTDMGYDYLSQCQFAREINDDTRICCY